MSTNQTHCVKKPCVKVLRVRMLVCDRVVCERVACDRVACKRVACSKAGCDRSVCEKFCDRFLCDRVMSERITRASPVPEVPGLLHKSSVDVTKRHQLYVKELLAKWCEKELFVCLCAKNCVRQSRV